MSFFIKALMLYLILSTIAFSKEKYNEDWHVKKWCHDINNPIKETGFVENVQEDKTRVDCLTDYYAIEFDWAKKYNEAIGQSLGYAIRTNRRPGIVLIITKESDIKYWKRLQEIVLMYSLPIQTFMMKSNNYIEK